MKLYIYAKTGHAYGLERLKRACALYGELKNFDPILCTTDFRAGAFAKEVFGVKKSVSVDLVENLPNLMQRGDCLIFDSDEPTPLMRQSMKVFCTEVYEIGVDISNDVVAMDFMNQSRTKSDQVLVFFGDDDYREAFLAMARGVEVPLDAAVLLGHYYFLGNEDAITSKFAKFYEDNEYIEAIKNHKFLLSGSIMSVLESLACGNQPVYFERADKQSDSTTQSLLEKYQIPIIKGDNLVDLLHEFYKIQAAYPKIPSLEIFNFEPIKETIGAVFKRYEKFNEELYRFE